MAYTLRITGSESEGFHYEVVNPLMAGTLSYRVEVGDFCDIWAAREIIDTYSGQIDCMAVRALTPQAHERQQDGADCDTFESIAREYRIECPVLMG